MLFSIFYLCTIFHFLKGIDQTGSDDNDTVLVLTDATVDEAIRLYPRLVLKFYAPWCRYCKEIAKDYALLAKEFAKNNSSVKFAEIDATEHPNTSRKYNIEEFPTIKYFSNGIIFNYEGNHNITILKNWLLKKGDAPATLIHTLDELEELKKLNDVVFVGLFKDTNPAFEVFNDVALAMNDNIAFGLIRDESLMNSISGKNDQIICFKQFDEERVEKTDDINKESLETFIKKNKLPLVTEFSAEMAKKIFAFKSNLILFVGKKNNKYNEIIGQFKEASKLFRGVVPFVHINTDDEDHDRIVEYFELKHADLPALRLIKLSDDMLKFKFDFPEIKSENIIIFVNDYLNNKLKPHYRSQALPDDWNSKAVKVLVRDNFNDVVNGEKTVLVEFYAPWCGHCQSLSPIYDSLGEYFSSRDDVVIAKMDATLNELDDIKIHSFPTIKLFRKDKRIIDFGGPRTLESLKKFVESEGQEGGSIPDEDQDEAVESREAGVDHKSHEEL